MIRYGWLEPGFTGHLIYLAQSKSMKIQHAGDSCSWKELQRSPLGGVVELPEGWAWAQTKLKEEGVIANRGNFGTQWLCMSSISYSFTRKWCRCASESRDVKERSLAQVDGDHDSINADVFFFADEIDAPVAGFNTSTPNSHEPNEYPQ